MLTQNKTSFVKRYLFTTEEDGVSIYEYELLRYQNSVAYEGLTIGFSEFFSLPIFLRESILDIQKNISSNKMQSLKNRH